MNNEKKNYRTWSGKVNGVWHLNNKTQALLKENIHSRLPEHQPPLIPITSIGIERRKKEHSVLYKKSHVF